MQPRPQASSPANDPPDAELIRRCQAGEAATFATLVERHLHLVFGIIVRSGCSAAEAAPLTSEVFQRLSRGLPYFRGEARLTTWLFRLMLSLLEERSVGPATAPAPAPSMRASTSGAWLDRALRGLPAGDRLLVAARRVEGVRDEDLAEALGIAAGETQAAELRVRRRLRTDYEATLLPQPDDAGRGALG